MTSAAPTIVLVSGLPAAGKTHLARRLAPALRLPLLSKDDYKEILFDTLGHDDPDRARLLGPTSFALLWHTVETLLAADVSLVVETHFYHDLSTPRLRELCARYQARALQIHLRADEETLRRRSAQRLLSGERHLGHGARAQTSASPQNPLALDGPLLCVDTTDFGDVDFEGIVAFVRSHQEMNP